MACTSARTWSKKEGKKHQGAAWHKKKRANTEQGLLSGGLEVPTDLSSLLAQKKTKKVNELGRITEAWKVPQMLITYLRSQSESSMKKRRKKVEGAACALNPRGKKEKTRRTKTMALKKDTATQLWKREINTLLGAPAG